MFELKEWLVFAMACVAVSLTPGPNMLYLTSRAICQGRSAALVSLWGVITAFSLALATHDGVLAILALLLTPLSIYLISSSLL